jgi:hypothetical protein
VWGSEFTTKAAPKGGLSQLLMNLASMLGPSTQTDRGTCPGVGL